MDKEKNIMTTFSKKERSLFSLLVLASGIIMFYFMVFPTMSSDLKMMEKIILSIFFLAIFLIPNIIYLVIGLKLKVKMKLLISAFFLVITQFFFTILSTYEVTHPSSSTSGLVFLVIWIPVTIALLLGLLIGYLIERANLKKLVNK